MKVETRKREEGKEGKKRETTDPKLTIFSQRQLPLMVIGGPRMEEYVEVSDILFPLKEIRRSAHDPFTPSAKPRLPALRAVALKRLIDAGDDDGFVDLFQSDGLGR